MNELNDDEMLVLEEVNRTADNLNADEIIVVEQMDETAGNLNVGHKDKDVDAIRVLKDTPFAMPSRGKDGNNNNDDANSEDEHQTKGMDDGFKQKE